MPAASRSARMWICATSPRERPASPARIWKTFSTRPRCSRYAVTAGVPGLDLAPIRESVAWLLSDAVDYEFRTTVVAQFHDEEAFLEIGPWLAGARRYFLQPFVDRDSVLRSGLTGCTPTQLERFLEILRPFVPLVALRGEP